MAVSYRYNLNRQTDRCLVQLDALCQIGRILSTGAMPALPGVLDVLEKKLGLARGVITILNPDGKERKIEAGPGVLGHDGRDLTYRMGEGVTGKVMATGQAAIVPRVSREPLFINRFERWNVTKEELSFLCVPISAGNRVVGTLSVDLPFKEDAPLGEEARLLELTATMIVNALRADRSTADDSRPEVATEARLHRDPASQTSDELEPATGSYKDRVHFFERDLIVDALKQCNGNLTATARVLKATPRVIRYRIRELGIDYRRYCNKRG